MRRREFMAFLGCAAAALPLTASAQRAAPLSPVRQDWLDRRKEPALEPELPIVDPHHHLWVRPGYRYMLDDFLADAGTGHNIVATVFVQANSMYRNSGPIEMRPVGETEFVNGMAAICASGYCGKTKVAAGIVGYADLRLGSRAEPVLAALSRAGGDRFRGVRFGTAWDADASLINPNNPVPPGLLGDKTFREGFAVLGRLGLSFDALVLHPQLNDVANLAGAFPDTKIVLNHVGRLVGIGAYAGKLKEQFPLGPRRSRHWLRTKMSTSKSADLARPSMVSDLRSRPSRRRPRWWRMRCAPMSRPVSKPSGRDVQCLKATFRLTRKA